MEFLDEQGVLPCGHIAREKGILIKMLGSCKFNEIPTKYRYLVNGAINEPTGEMSFLIAKQLSETQTTVSVDSSHLRCNSNTIDELCTLQSVTGYPWLGGGDVKTSETTATSPPQTFLPALSSSGTRFRYRIL